MSTRLISAFHTFALICAAGAIICSAFADRLVAAGWM